eukprot:4858154-Prymnesium_polylepis.1
MRPLLLSLTCERSASLHCSGARPMLANASGTDGCTPPDDHAGPHSSASRSKRERRPTAWRSGYDEEPESTETQRRVRRVKKPKLQAVERESTAKEQANAQARAEGVVLVPAHDCATGFKGVTRSGDRFRVVTYNGRKEVNLGTFNTAEAAALAYARHIGPEETAAAAAEAAGPELTAEQAKAQARAEGLVLVGAATETGFKGVSRSRGSFQARAYEGGKMINLGYFRTPEAAALAYAYHMKAAAPSAAPYSWSRRGRQTTTSPATPRLPRRRQSPRGSRYSTTSTATTAPPRMVTTSHRHPSRRPSLPRARA